MTLLFFQAAKLPYFYQSAKHILTINSFSPYYMKTKVKKTAPLFAY